MNVRHEDLQMKVPALLHLSRLGYGYLAGAQLRGRDRRTNVLPDVLKTAVERINQTTLSEEALTLLAEHLLRQLDAGDLGKQFCKTLRTGWNGLRLIDFGHPENNLFQSASELVCGSGAACFRPDITLFVNGLPLGIIELKAGSRSRGLQAEYDRMLERFRSKEGHRYLQCAQIWAFSDDRAGDPDSFFPLEGACFAAVMPEGFPVYSVRGKYRAGSSRLLPRNPEDELKILEANRLASFPHTRAFQRSLSPGKPTHRMLTELFRPDRFLFLLRYGIRYIQETDPDGSRTLTRRMLTADQLSGLRLLAEKAKRGYRNWTVPPCGAAGERAANASLIDLLRDLEPGAELFWVSPDKAALQQDYEALQTCEISCARRTDAASGQLNLITADEDPGTWLPAAAAQNPSVRMMFILPQPVPGYGRKAAFPATLRRAAPNAVLITRASDRIPESLLPPDLPAPAGSALYLFMLPDQTI